MPLLLFFLYPVLEIALWWKFISNFGFGDAVLWCLLSAIVGFYIVRSQGSGAMEEFQRAAAGGTMPSSRIAHRILMSFGGFLLILPGVITDVAGALLVLPGTRHLIVWLVYKKLARTLMKGFASGGGPGFSFTFMSGGAAGGFSRPGPTSDPNVIDVEARVIEDDQPRIDSKKE
ncbi:MAG: FxsA family protein [Bdellovibrionaceae bacterium]|nr:FxsA family protein [Pseudobdellovibrionaceae bacterium]